MKWYFEILEHFVNFYEAFLLVGFIKSMLETKIKSDRKENLYHIIAILIFMGTIELFNYHVIYEGMSGFLYSLELFFYACFCFQGKWREKLILSILSVALTAVVSIGVMYLCMTFSNQTLNHMYSELSMERCFGLFLTMILLTYFIQIIKQTKAKYQFQWMEWIIVFSSFFYSCILIFLLNEILLKNKFNEQSSMILFFIVLGICVLNLFVFYFVVLLNKKNKKIYDAQMLHQKDILYRKNMEMVKKEFDEAKQIRHDLKYSYQWMLNLLEQKQYLDIEEYLKERLKQVQQTKQTVFTENEFVNAILNTKIYEARQQAIDVKVQITTKFLGIEEEDLCCILGNLLDNAIEANQKIVKEKRYLSFSIAGDQYKIILIQKNASLPVEQDEQGTLLTDKSEKHLHGYGYQSVKRIAKKYQGIAEYEYLENEFECALLLFRR